MENEWQDEKEISEEFAEAFRNGEGAWHPNFEKMLEWWLDERRDGMEKVLSRLLAELHTTKYPSEDGVETMRIVRHIVKDYLLTIHYKK